jgi:hypothetical protein
MHVGGIFCDLVKAFDYVNHEILLTNLHFFLHSRSNSKLVQILPNRKQKTEIKSSNLTQSTYSKWGTIKHGDLQGSILEPLLFIIYINDLPPTLNTSSIPIIFANDISFIIFNKNLDDSCILSKKFSLK